MRPIIFRGKRVDNGEWIEGDLSKIQCRVYISQFVLDDTFQDGAENKHLYKHFWVLPETVGEYTGLKDKNGKKIFEGDILKHLHTSVEIKSYYEYMEVFYDEETASFYAGYEELWLICGGSEVIGNVIDNPELLEVDE